jgi:methionyl-tRNA synthetase
MIGMTRNLGWDEAVEPFLAEGHVLGEAQILFTKIKDESIDREVQKLKGLDSGGGGGKAGFSEKISFDTFKKVELRTARVISAERVPKSDKLLRLQLDLGGEHRQIVAGIAQSYTPEAMAGKTVLIVANLEPAVIRGVESHGMLLAVKTEKGHALITADQDIPAGVRAE